MFPLYDDNPSEKRPYVTWSLIAINAGVFLGMAIYTSGFSRFDRYAWVLFAYGATPVRVARALSAFNLPVLLTSFTSMFIHADLFHILGNMVFLYIFGDNVEDTFGRFRYIAFYLFSGIVGGALHGYLALMSQSEAALVPAVGASGAISGVLGAYLVLFPRAKVFTAVILGYFIRLVPLPALVYLGFWFLLQFLYGAAGSAGGVAYWAHIGGFLTGAILGLLTRSLGSHSRRLPRRL